MVVTSEQAHEEFFRLKFFALGAWGLNFQSFQDVDYLVLGSFDGRKWIELGLDKVPGIKAERDYKIYQIKNLGPYKSYRFYLYGETVAQLIDVAGMHIKLDIETSQ